MRGDRTPHSHFTWLLTRLSSRSRPPGETGPDPRAALLAPPGHSLYIRLPGRRNRVAVRSSRHSNVMLNEVYNSRILELAGNIPRLGRLEQPDASATAHSKLCGSTVTVDLRMDGDTITDF